MSKDDTVVQAIRRFCEAHRNKALRHDCCGPECVVCRARKGEWKVPPDEREPEHEQ